MIDKTISDNFFLHSNDLFCVMEFDGSITLLNPAWESLLGYATDELVSKSIFDFIDPDDLFYTIEYFEAITKNTGLQRIENRFLSKSGIYHWLSWNAYPDHDNQLIYAIARDINTLKARESKLTQLADIVEHSSDAIISHTVNGIILSWNRGAEIIYGFSHEEMIGKSVFQLFPDDKQQEFNDIIQQIKENIDIQQYETVHQCKKNKLINMSLSYAPIFSSSKKLLAVSCIGRNITQQKRVWEELLKHREELDSLVEQRTQELSETNLKLHQEIAERKRVEEQLRLLADKDTLTGLLNRRRFLELMDQEFTRSKRYGLPLTLLAIDIDHFKQINDTYGHAAGDEVLKAFAHAGQQVFRSIDIFGRTGGEEFAVLLPETPLDGAQEAAERFRSTIEAMTVNVENNTIHITVSIGIALVNNAVQSVQSMMTNGDQALYAAKHAGRNRWVVFDENSTSALLT